MPSSSKFNRYSIHTYNMQLSHRLTNCLGLMVLNRREKKIVCNFFHILKYMFFFSLNLHTHTYITFPTQSTINIYMHINKYISLDMESPSICLTFVLALMMHFKKRKFYASIERTLIRVKCGFKYYIFDSLALSFYTELLNGGWNDGWRGCVFGLNFICIFTFISGSIKAYPILYMEYLCIFNVHYMYMSW